MRSPGSALVLRAGASYFALVFGAGFVLGSIRILFLVPRLGERVAELLEAPIMLVVIFFASRYVVRRFALAARASLAVGLLALLLLLAAEFLLAVAVSNQSVSGYIASRDPVSGSVYLAALVVYAVLPWLHARKGGKSGMKATQTNFGFDPNRTLDRRRDS